MRRLRMAGLACLHVLVLIALAGGCAGPHPSPVAGLRAAACREAPGLPPDLKQAGRVALFGEIHGSEEIPAFFGEAVCAAGSSGLRVEVGLEIPAGEQASVDAFLASQGGPADLRALLASPFWTRDYQDGRSSRAVSALLERLRSLRASGLDIGVFLFDLDPGEPVSGRDAKMAGKIAAHARVKAGALHMVLTGEVHAWKSQGAPWDPDFLPMGLHLAREGLDVLSLGRATPAGSAWICTGAEASRCGEARTGATGTLPSGRAAGIELLDHPSPRGNDGLYATPALTASAPARLAAPGDGGP